MRAIQKTIAGLLILILLPISAFAKVASWPLKEAIKYSGVIVIGKVTKVMECYQDSVLGNLKIAELEVTQTVKSKSYIKHLYFWASPSWACDVSNAHDGETLLLLLEPDYSRLSETSDFLKETPTLAKILRQYMQDRPIYNIAQSGGGKMLIENHQIALNDYLDYPEHIADAARKQTEMSEYKFVNYDLMMTYIKRQVIFFRKRA
jgi:hypothetical protein